MKPLLPVTIFITILSLLLISSCEQRNSAQGKIDQDTFDSYVVLSNDILRTNKTMDKKNKGTLDIMAQKMQDNRVKIKPFYDKAMIVEHWSRQLCNYIDTLKAVLISKTLNVPKTEADTLRIGYLGLDENADTPELIMLENAPDYLGRDGAAYLLKSRLGEYRKAVIKLVKPEDTTALQIRLYTRDVIKEGPMRKETWEKEHFQNRPLIPTIIILSKLQNDIKYTESAIIDQQLLYAATPDTVSQSNP